MEFTTEVFDDNFTTCLPTEKIISKLPTLQLIASGGVSKMKDLIELRAIGCSAAIVGKAIYENRITLEELSKFNETK